jgi:hypothetical protein
MDGYRGRIDDPGFMEGILADIRSKPREYWQGFLDRYENEKPGDIVLPGVPPDDRFNSGRCRIGYWRPP